MPRVVVVGGGISGLSSARGIADRVPDAEITVLEAGALPGGTAQTRHVAGFACETGPNGFLNAHPSTLALALKLGLEGDLITGCEQVRRRFVLHGGRLRRFPDSPATFLQSDLLSVRARLRMLLEPLVPPSSAGSEETVGQFARRRLGREAAALLVEPVVSGIYAGDAARLGLRDALPHLASLDGRGKSLMRAFISSRRDAAQGSGTSPTTIGRRRLVSFRGGVGQLVDALADSLGPALRCDSPVQAVRRDGRGWRVVVGGPAGAELAADAIVLAVPAARAAELLGAIDAGAAQACTGIRHAPLAMVALGYREADVPHPLDGFGYLVAGAEHGSVLGVYWSSSVFPGCRSPSGMTLLQAVLGGARDPSICAAADDEIFERTCEQLHGALGIAAAPVMARTFRHPLGLPQYDVGHRRRVAAVEAAEVRHPGLFVTGNAFRGVGLNACTADAERVAQGVASFARVGTAAPRGTDYSNANSSASRQVSSP